MTSFFGTKFTSKLMFMEKHIYHVQRTFMTSISFLKTTITNSSPEMNNLFRGYRGRLLTVNRHRSGSVESRRRH